MRQPRFVATTGVIWARRCVGEPRTSHRRWQFAAPIQHDGEIGTYRRYPPLQDGDASGGRVSSSRRRAARTMPVVGNPAPRGDARTVPVSPSVTARASTTGGWAATSGSSGQQCSRRLPRPLLCPRRTASWGTGVGLPSERWTSSSSRRVSGGPGLPWGGEREARTRSRTGRGGPLR